jgi:hypothetical protein
MRHESLYGKFFVTIGHGLVQKYAAAEYRGLLSFPLAVNQILRIFWLAEAFCVFLGVGC